jgi:hypothetical protein
MEIQIVRLVKMKSVVMMKKRLNVKDMISDATTVVVFLMINVVMEQLIVMMEQMNTNVNQLQQNQLKMYARGINSAVQVAYV